MLQNQIVGKKESVQDELLLLNPLQTPMLDVLGVAEPVVQTEHAWFEDKMVGKTTTVATELTAAATELDVVDGSIFEPEHVIKVGDELLIVKNVVGNKLTVVRGYAKTVAAIAAVGTEVEFQFVEGVEGADARKARYKGRKRESNLTQIFDETIKISGSKQATSQHSIDDLYEYEKQKKQLELALQLEKAVINGVKYESENGAVRQMGGLRYFIKTNVTDAAKGAITLDMLGDAFQAIFEAGGFESGANYKIVVGAKQKRAISKIDADKVNLDRKDNGRGQVADFFLSDFGEVEIILNNNVDPNEVFIVDLERVKVRPLQTREFAHQYLGVKGDYIEGQIVGEYTIELQQEQAHARIRNLA